MGIDTDRYIMGAGRVYLRRHGEDYAFDVRETSALTLSISSTTDELQSSDSRVPHPLCSVTTSREVTGTMATQNMTARNIALWLGADVTTETVTGGTETVTIDPVVVGVWYPLGDTYVTVTDVEDADTTNTIPTAQYEVDETGGMIRFTNSALAAAELEVTYTIASADDVTIVADSDSASSPTYELRFIADNAGCSPERDQVLVLPAVKLAPSGDWTLKSRTEWQTLTWDLTVMADTVSSELVRIIQRVAQ